MARALRSLLLFAGPLPLALFAAGWPGCDYGDRSNAALGGSAWDSDLEVAVLAPFQGKWRLDDERTLAIWEAEGKAAAVDQVRQMRRRLASQPLPAETERALRAAGIDPAETMRSAARLHPHLTFSGHIAQGVGLPSEEYRLFAIHEHERVVCAKAWHHEDRFDHGDMSKAFMRLELVDGRLHLRVRMQDGLLAIDDADLRDPLPVLAAPDAPCDSDRPGGRWSEWTVYVFTRDPS